MKLKKNKIRNNKLTRVLRRYKSSVQDWFDEQNLKRKYKDYTPSKYDNGHYKFIWGVKSDIDYSGVAPSLYSMNDIDICFDRDNQEYVLGIETAYWFEDRNGEIKYLEHLLKLFTEYMTENGYNTDERFIFWMSTPTTSLKAKTIPELYTNFKIFISGYKSVYDNGKE